MVPIEETYLFSMIPAYTSRSAEHFRQRIPKSVVTPDINRETSHKFYAENSRKEGGINRNDK